MVSFTNTEVALIAAVAAAVGSAVFGYYIWSRDNRPRRPRRRRQLKEKGPSSRTAARHRSRLPPKPTACPRGNVFAGVGNWPVPFEVRYAIQYLNRNGDAGPMSDWSPWYSSNYYSNNVLSHFSYVGFDPRLPGTPATINLWRQFRGQRPTIVANLGYPFRGKHVDMEPNQG